MEKCEYCQGSDLKRKPIMTNSDGNWVIINPCGYLEESRTSVNLIGIYVGIKLKLCPMCGRKL